MARNPNVPAIPVPTATQSGLHATVSALKMGVESLAGQRGGELDRAVTFNDLVRLGLVTGAAATSPTGTSSAIGSSSTTRTPYRFPEDYGAVGDGTSRPASAALGVTTVEELQAYRGGMYAFADSIDNEMDYLGIQAALYAGGIVRGMPMAWYVVDHTLNVPNGRVSPDFTYCTLSWEGLGYIEDDGTNLVVDGDFSSDGSDWTNTLLEPAVDWTFTGGYAEWIDGDPADANAHFGQMGQQIHIPKGRYTIEATATITAGASAGRYGPPYVWVRFFADHVGQGQYEWPDPLDKGTDLSPGDDGVPTLIFFDFEIPEDEGRTVWLTFGCGNADIKLEDVRIKPHRMNYAIWCSGDPMEHAQTTYEDDDSTWTGGLLIGPNENFSPIYVGPEIGGILHKNFRSDGSRCNFVDVKIFKFHVGVTLSDHAYLNKFDSVNIGFCDTCVKFLLGSTNAAENYHFSSCILFNSRLAVHAEGGGEWYFWGSSWDYCRTFLKTDRGAYIASHGLHIEGHQAETYIPVEDWSAFDDGETITGSTSGATARVISDKGDQDWDEGPRIVVEVLSGTFAVGETITGPSGGSATVAAELVVGPYMFDIRGASMWNFVSGEILFAGFTHNGAPYIGNVESNMDQISFGSVWLYNLHTASDVTWTGGGRVTVQRHMGPTNPNFARLWLENHQSDAHGGMGDFTTDGGLPGIIVSDELPEDGIPLDIYTIADTGRDTRTEHFDGPSLSIDTGVARVTGGASLRLDIPDVYGAGQRCNIRLLIPVTGGKVVLDRYYIHKPDVMPEVTHGPFTGGASLTTFAGSNSVILVDPSTSGLAGAGAQAGWQVTLSGVTGDPGGIPDAELNGVHTIAEVTEDGIILEVGADATTNATLAGGGAIETTYTQNNFLVWDRRLWVRVISRLPWDHIPVIVQDQYQGESNYNVDFAAVDWMLANPEGNRWWYTERLVPDDPMERIGSGRAPEWATHMLVDINFWNLLHAVDGTSVPPIYLAGFFANVV